ncbi:MAG TPA: DUF488 domain-containing protein [Longimicrobiales bacterium]|nr:DUF488 domain-containing protein [Longimicrobiales bacterium]
MSSPGTLYTVGHSNRDAPEFLELLRSHGVQEVVDVRRYPGSRRNPQFGGEALEATLADAGIGYTHMEALGGRRGRPAPDSPNTGWRVASFQAYADHMAEPEWLQALGALEERAGQRAVAIMCSEAVPWRCHRRLIADALVVRGWDVRHILGAGRSSPHELQDFARVLPDARIIYPGV